MLSKRISMINFQHRTVKFVVGGGMSAATEFLTFLVFKSFVPIFWAALFSFCCGLAVSYVLNSRFVFAALEKRDRKRSSRQFVQFLVLAGANALISSSGVSLLQHFLSSAVAAKVVMMVLVATWNYFIMKLYIFSDHKN